MSQQKVVVTDFLDEPFDVERQILGDVARVVGLNAVRETDLDERLEDADAIMMYHVVAIRRPTIERLKHCKLIVRCGVGYDNIDTIAAREHGITVANVPDYGSEEVADSAIGMMLALTRGIHFFNQRLQQPGPWTYTTVGPLHRLRGRTLGVIGIGRIGAAAALRGKALGLNVIFYDPYVVDGTDKALGVERVEELDELLTRSDIVSLHCPLTEQTRHIVDAAAIARMKRGAYLVNTARGSVVDTSAVLPAIESGHLAGVALDVLEVEPPSDDDPLLVAWRDPSHPANQRLIINPHSAFYSEQGLGDMRIKGSRNCLRALRGETIRNVVN